MKIAKVKKSSRDELSIDINHFGSQITGLYNRDFFREQLTLERRRSERSKKPFFLVSLDLKEITYETAFDTRIIKKIGDAISVSSRESDIRGWYSDPDEIGIIYTEVTREALENILNKLRKNLTDSLGNELTDRIEIRFTVFPEEDGKIWVQKRNKKEIIYLYDTLNNNDKRVQVAAKRMLDIIISTTCIVIFSPLMMVVAVMIKATSKGPVLFKQERIGLHGEPFRLWKFRSMKTNNSSTIHKEYVKKLISGDLTGNANGNSTTFKIKDDPRVTNIGKFIRKTSIDELPQLFNVLTGHMSLVGPRPPIGYEVEAYDVWHRRRVIQMKPGITGLWQVKGRSLTTFDGMVRMDIEYINNWSLWLDILLILKTPGAVLAGKGAY